MNSQNLILLGIGVFVSLIAALIVVDRYLLAEHDPMDPGGLIWRVEAAFSRVRDLEATLETTGGAEAEPVRAVVRYVSGARPAVSIRYLEPASLEDQVMTVDGDLLSQYFPAEKLIVVKRWFGTPLAAVGLAGLDVSRLARDAQAGRVALRVRRDVLHFSGEGLSAPIRLPTTVAGVATPEILSFLPADGVGEAGAPSVAGLGEGSDAAIPGGFVLEATDARTGELVRLVWVDRETFLVTKVIFFERGRQTSSLRLEQIVTNQELAPRDVLDLPRGADVRIVRG